MLETSNTHSYVIVCNGYFIRTLSPKSPSQNQITIPYPRIDRSIDLFYFCFCFALMSQSSVSNSTPPPLAPVAFSEGRKKVIHKRLLGVYASLIEDGFAPPLIEQAFTSISPVSISILTN